MSAVPAADRRPARRRQDGRRAELIAAASRVVARDGISRATTRRIAEEAGVPPGLVHYWFADRQELINAVIDDTLNPVALAIAEAAVRDGHPDLLSQLRAVFAFLQTDDWGREIAMYEMTTFLLRRPKLRDVARRQYAAYREMGSAAATQVAESRGVALPAPASAVGTLVASLVDGLFLAWLADPEGTDVDAVLRLLDEMLLPPPATDTPQGEATST